jgi:toxin ParE1/3/4
LAYRVDIAEPALIEAEEYFRFIRDNRKEPEAAERWFRGLVRSIYSLEESPERCPLIPEQDEFPFEIRHLIYFSHRIIFAAQSGEGRVVIYRIYHGAKRPLSADDVDL